jgi:hypothetical protein
MGSGKSLQRLALGVLALVSAVLLGESLIAPAGSLALTSPGRPPLAAGPNLAAAGEIPPTLLDDVLLAAAAQNGVPLGRLTVIRAEATTWPNAALGCPQPGMAYATGATRGYWIVLEAGGQLLDYRTDARGDYRRCIAD